MLHKMLDSQASIYNLYRLPIYVCVFNYARRKIPDKKNSIHVRTPKENFSYQLKATYILIHISQFKERNDSLTICM